MIDKPGIYLGMATATYFGDPCPAPSLTQSVAKLLLDRSPLHAWHAHPRLNPDYRHDDDTKFDVGNIAHKLLLGRGKEIVRLDHDDWRTKAAKEAREAAAADGKLAALGKHYARADRMVAAAREQLELRGLAHFFRDGDGEAVVAWKEDNIWLRQMIDWLTPDRRTFVDLKTTDLSAAPHNLGRMMVNSGWHVQAAMAQRGLDAVDPDGAGRRRYFFVVQECDSPYALNVAEISEGALTIGRKMLVSAVTQWKICMGRSHWPAYPMEIFRPEIPGWAESAWLEREIEDDQRREHMPADLLMAG